MSFRINSVNRTIVDNKTLPAKGNEIRSVSPPPFNPSERKDFRYKPNPVEDYVPPPIVITDPHANRVPREVIVYDKILGEWKIVDESEEYKYNY